MSRFIEFCGIILPFLTFFWVSKVQGAPSIVKPFPNNVYVIEGEKTQITCVVADDDPSAEPDKILFVRKTRFGETTLILDQGPDGRVYYENKTLDGGKKLSVTLHLRQVTKQDGSTNGGYECQGYTNTTSHKYGFTVTVIGRDELPGIQVSDNVTAEFGDKIVLSCNLTMNTGGMTDQTKLSNLKWIKDGVVIDEVLYPREQSLKSRVIEINAPEDGGMYSCHLTSKLRKVKDYNISDSIVVTVQPAFFGADLKDNKIVALKGEVAVFPCTAQGNPLNTEWIKKLKSKGKAEKMECQEHVNNSRCIIESKNKLKGHTLTIAHAKYADRGKYYCCIASSNRTREPDDVSDCEAFTLRVKDPLGPLWPVIGIIIEVILLIIIIVISEKLKKKKNKSSKVDGRAEFSYSSTDDTGDKGQVRLRQAAAAEPEKA